MSTARPLKLKTQKVLRPETQPALSKPIARVWVDNSVAHLDGIYDYLIPERFSDQIRSGIRISVPFSGRSVEALVVDRVNESETSSLKYISGVLSPLIVAPTPLIKLIADASLKWIAHPFDIVRSAIPARVAAVDKEFLFQEAGTPKVNISRKSIEYLHILAHQDALQQLANFALKRVENGSVLIILPEERELERIKQILGKHAVVLSASLNRSERYRNYLQALKQERTIIIGTRSAIFAAPNDLRSIIVFREGAQSHYEPRTPGWNVRDLAFMRAKNENIDLFFIGYSPSAEVALQIDNGGIVFRGKRSKLSVEVFPTNLGELLPARIFSPIRSALKDGAVLFLVPRKGYASAMVCRKCRNIATCSCGSRIIKRASNEVPSCQLCSQSYPDWRCRWCASSEVNMASRGALRHAEEIGRAFTGYSVMNSDASTPIAEISGQSALVITTSSMAPLNPLGYSAVVVLDGNSFFSYADLRAQERARETLFETAGLVKKNGKVLLAIDAGHPIASSIARWNPAILSTRELGERAEVGLPPSSSTVIIDIAHKEVISVANGFKKALLDQRIPSSTRVLGPATRDSELSRIVLTVSPAQEAELAKFLSAYFRARAISKKPHLYFRVNPYSLS